MREEEIYRSGDRVELTMDCFVKTANQTNRTDNRKIQLYRGDLGTFVSGRCVEDLAKESLVRFDRHKKSVAIVLECSLKEVK